MIVKIKDFNNIVTSDLPLRQGADALSISITRNGIEQRILKDQQGLFIVGFFSDEVDSLDSIKPTVNASPGATYVIIQNPDDLLKYEIHVSSEDRETISYFGIQYVQVTDSINKSQVFSITDLNTDTNVIIHKQTNSNVGIIRIPYYDNSTKWINLDVHTNFPSTTDISLISFYGDEPDNETISQGSVITEFDIDETIFLDSSKIYVKVKKLGDVAQYFRIDKSAQNDDIYVNQIKTKIGNKWVNLFFNKYAVPVLLDYQKLTYAHACTAEDQLKQYFSASNIEFFDISNMQTELIDSEASTLLHSSSTSKLQLQNNIEYIGLGQFGIEYPGANFAKLIHDELSVLQNIELTHGSNEFFRQIYDPQPFDCTVDSTELTSNISTVALMLSLSMRLLNHMNVYLRWIQENSTQYEISTNELNACIHAVESIITSKKELHLSSVSIVNVDQFFKSLRSMKLIKNTILSRNGFNIN